MPSQHTRLADTVRRFDELELVLPDLHVTFADDRGACHGHHGLFQPGQRPWRITLCSDLEWVHGHELAHAWEATNVTADQRVAFLRLRGYEVWSDRDVSWHRRGMEGAARIIQQGVNGPPLPTTLSAEHRSRLAAFRLLTGFADPRLESWGAP